LTPSLFRAGIAFSAAPRCRYFHGGKINEEEIL
jgi:hypothetical protein